MLVRVGGARVFTAPPWGERGAPLNHRKDACLSTSVAPLLSDRVHHYGYVVQDLEQTIGDLATKLGIGPFFIIENVPLEQVRSEGEEAEFSHSSGFAQCGDAPIEIMQIHSTSPALVSAHFSQPRPQIHHVAWAVPSLEEAIARLDRSGFPPWLGAELGDIRFTYHDATPLLGHHIELHDDSPGFRGFFTMIREASEGWDGSDPIRTPAF